MMNSLDIERIFLDSNMILGLITIFSLFVTSLYLATIILETKTGKRFNSAFKRFFSKFFYSETNVNENVTTLERLDNLEKKLENFKNEIEQSTIKENIPDISKSIESFLSEHLTEMISKKIDEFRLGDQIVLKEIEKITKQEVNNYLATINIETLTKEALHFQSAERKKMNETILDDVSTEQMRNTGQMKSVMINLFVLFNIGILLSFIFGNITAMGRQEVLYGVTGLYVSLAAFIIYIYRASNARSRVIMAIREDAKKYYDVIDYLAKFKHDGKISEQDIDLIRILLINRSEREKGTEHPYEMVFKSIAGSNIQFKGGKMSVSKDASTTKKND